VRKDLMNLSIGFAQPYRHIGKISRSVKPAQVSIEVLIQPLDLFTYSSNASRNFEASISPRVVVASGPWLVDVVVVE
jgi:hypothetical protein